MEGEVSKDKKTTSKADQKKLKEELDNENNLQESTDSEKVEMEDVKEEASENRVEPRRIKIPLVGLILFLILVNVIVISIILSLLSSKKS